MPPPRSPAFAPAAAEAIADILRRTRGRAFVLFTSYAMLRFVESALAGSLDYPLLVQGEAPRSALVERFRQTPNAVLLATSSFWQGVDVVGEALSCVIVDKLPFASPADPVTAARLEAIAARGGDPFSDYQVPLAILALQQGLGRLLRHRRDRGVLAVLDPRLRTMGYGRRFLAALPPAPQTLDPARIDAFFAADARSQKQRRHLSPGRDRPRRAPSGPHLWE
jgi:ATP-dependent DNA helicase DinG